MGTLDQPQGTLTTQTRYSKVVNIHGLTRPETKAILDEKMANGWELVCIYHESNKARAVMTRMQDD